MTDFNTTNPNQITNENVHGFKYLLKLAFRLRYWILASVLVLGAVVFVSLRFVEKQYMCTTKVAFEPKAFIYVMKNRDTINFYKSNVASDCREMRFEEMKSTTFLQYFADSSSLKLSVDDIRAHLSIDFDKNSNILCLNYKTTNPQRGDSILSDFVNIYNAYSFQNQLIEVRNSLHMIDRAIQILKTNDTSLLVENEILAQIAQTCRDGQTSQMMRNALLQHKVDVCMFLEGMPPALTVIEAPSCSDVPVSPHSKFLYLLAVCLGIFLPLIVAEFVDYMKSER